MQKASTRECNEIGPVVSASQNNGRGPPNAKVSGKPDGGPGGTRLAARTRTVTLQLAPKAVPVQVSEGAQGKSREPGPGVRLVRFTVLLGGPGPGLGVRKVCPEPCNETIPN